MNILSCSAEETERIGERLAQSLTGNEFIALYGGMGMGKTAFVRGLARGLDIRDEVTSPTFALVHEYTGKFRLYHFDMYRVEGWDDLYSTGFFDYEGRGVIVTEWSENIENAIPENAIRICFSAGDTENMRNISCDGINIF